MRCAGALVAALVAVAGACPLGAAPLEGIPGSIATDSLLMPTETFVLTRDDLACYNVHTLDDVLRLLPGVVLWREGPPGSYGGFSIDARSSRGLNLLVNGVPVVDPYTLESMARFIPLSRLARVEVLYSGSPHYTCGSSSNGAVNVVLEEGGREAPATEVNFTYGGSKQRVRRAWFATPRAHIGGVLAYDEYLQDAAELYAASPSVKLGQYDMRAVLGELDIRSTEGDEIVVRLERFEDWYRGTALSASEELRSAGFGSEITYRRGGFSGSLRERGLTLTRAAGSMENLSSGASLRMARSLGPLAVRAFASAERSEFDNRLWGVTFDPSCSRVEGGALLGARIGSGVTVRGGAFGGDHDVVGRYGGAEFAVAREWSPRFTQSVMIARRVRIPSARELFQPLVAYTNEGLPDSTVGSRLLSPEITDEVSLGARAPHLTIDAFARNERSRIILVGKGQRIYRAEGSGSVAGARGRYAGTARLLGLDCSLAVGAEAFAKRSGVTSGIPSYRLTGELGISRGIFGGAERASLSLNSEVVGRRSWEGTELDAYHVHGIAASLTVMGARVSFEYRNVLDAEYETVPGYLMPRRYFLIGIFWELFD